MITSPVSCPPARSFALRGAPGTGAGQPRAQRRSVQHISSTPQTHTHHHLQTNLAKGRRYVVHSTDSLDSSSPHILSHFHRARARKELSPALSLFACLTPNLSLPYSLSPQHISFIASPPPQPCSRACLGEQGAGKAVNENAIVHISPFLTHAQDLPSQMILILALAVSMAHLPPLATHPLAT